MAVPRTRLSETSDTAGIIVAPSPEAAFSAFRPLSGERFKVDDDFWNTRQFVNRTVSIEEAYDRLEEYGGLAYLRAAAEHSGIPSVPHVFNDPHVYKILDSDIFKWLEAVAYEQIRQPLSHKLRGLADSVVDLIVRSQNEDGYIHSWNSVHDAIDTGPRWLEGPRPLPTAMRGLEGHELYNWGHLIQAGIAWSRAFGEERLLTVARKMVAYLDGLRTANPKLLPQHPGIEMALTELYRQTGEDHYLEMAQDFMDRRGHNDLGFWWFAPDHFVDSQPVRGSHDIKGHSVMAFYLLCGAVDIAVETGDDALLMAAESQWEDFVSTKMYLTGGAGSRQHDEAFGEPFELSPDTAYAETCAAIGSVMLSWRLLLATGKSRYADLIERTMYNAVLPGVSLDGHTYLYVNPLYVREPGRILTPDGYGHRQRWYECACCPPNLMRAISSIGQLSWTSDSSGLQLHQYIGGTVAVENRALRVTSDAPFGTGAVSVEVVTTDDAEWTLRVRVPDWSPNPAVSFSWSEQEEAATTDSHGYFAISRRWKVGDVLTLKTEPDFAIVAADPRMDAYRGQRAIMRGPIVYCVEEVDLEGSASVDSISLPANARISSSQPPTGLASAVAAEVELAIAGLPAPTLNPYHGASEPQPLTTHESVALVPYFAWAIEEQRECESGSQKRT